ncbi:hypothetical protein BOO94_13785 [Pseudomonas sp. FSL W5-0299]|nr:hypothetical protein BOO94_13785 [Pseudomonas sp. FSL W5-0299]
MDTVSFHRNIFETSIGKIRTKFFTFKGTKIRRRQNFPIFLRANHLNFKTAFTKYFYISDDIIANTTGSDL